MPALNIVLLLVIVGGLTLFAWQNWSPSLFLVFLGMPTPTLPLAVWILLALAAGVMTGLSIAALFRWYSYLEASNMRRRPRYDRESAYPAGSSHSQESQASETNSIGRSQTSYKGTSARESFAPIDDSSKKAAVPSQGDRSKKAAVPTNDDWEQENKISDDWEDVGTVSTPREKGDNAKAEQPKGTDSFYSIGSQDKSNSGVGKAEDVYEANYRVISPPVGQESEEWKNRKNYDGGENDEDWGLDEDDT